MESINSMKFIPFSVNLHLCNSKEILLYILRN